MTGFVMGCIGARGGRGRRGETLEECGHHQRKGSHHHCETDSVA